MSRTRKIKLPQFDEKEIVTFVNPGEWFSRRWLIGVGAGFFCLFYIVEGDYEQDVIDNLVDSKWGHIVKTDDMCDVCEKADKLENPPDGSWDECSCDFAGNYGERVDLTDIRILERLT